MPRRSLTPSEEDYVRAHHLGRLATATADGAPHVVPVMYAYADGAFWISSDPGDLKHRHLEDNPRAALVVDEPPPAKTGVVVRGAAKVFTDGVDFRRAQDHLQEREPRHAPGEQVYIRLTPEEVASWRL